MTGDWLGLALVNELGSKLHENQHTQVFSDSLNDKLALKPAKQPQKLGLYLPINMDRIICRQCEFIYGDVIMLIIISFADNSRDIAHTILSCSNFI